MAELAMREFGQAKQEETTSALEQRIAALEARIRELEPRTVGNKATLVVFSGELDKVMAALVIATGAAAMGMEVSMFHTFWGLNALRKGRTIEGKGLIESALSLMMPAGFGELQPSQMRFAGAGAKLLLKRMKDQSVQSPEELFALAREMGVKITACAMSMDVMGIGHDELVDGVEIGGVAAYLADAADSKVTLFV